MHSLLLIMVITVAAASEDSGTSRSFSESKPKWLDMEELLKTPKVLRELKLTPNQSMRAQMASLEPLAKHTAEVNKLQGLPEDQFLARMQALSEEYNGRQREAVGKALPRAQGERIKQIQVQGAGLDAFVQPCLQKELELTAEQKTKLLEKAKEFRAAVGNLEKPGAPKAAVKKLSALREETMKELVGLLTDKQKKTWKVMVGEPFQFEDRK
jgi:hypothetical protein